MTTKKVRLARVLSEFARTMGTDFPIQAILSHLVGQIIDVLPVTAAGVTVISEGAKPHYVAASDAAALRFEMLQTEMTQGPCVLAFNSGEAVAVPDLLQESRFGDFAPKALAAGLAAVFAFPLRHGDIQIGALDLYRDTPGPLSSADLDIAQTLADVTAAYLLNAQARVDLNDALDRSRHDLLHDELTGLPNRRLLLERLDQAFLRNRRSSRASAVLFVDLDRFKSVNDTHGHQTGDELLIAVAGRLTGLVRPEDTVARLSGDEFVILCQDLDHPAQAESIGSRLVEALAEPFELTRTRVSVSASVGIAFTDDPGYSPEQLMHEADMSMYRAKHHLGGRPGIYQLRSSDARQSDLVRSLREAVRRGEIHNEYQPIVAADDGRILGLEALARWVDPQLGAVSPSTFIPLAESAGLIRDIGTRVMREAWAQRGRWIGPDGRRDIAVAVNVSVDQLMANGFTETVKDALESGPGDPHLLTLELTESVFIRDSERALSVLNSVKDLGVGLALDDFGTGYSSLGYLDRFPVDLLKIDRSFVANLPESQATRTIVGAVVQLAHRLDIKVIAEGVETFDQHHQVVELGCDSCQGYLYGRSMIGADVDTFLRRRQPQWPSFVGPAGHASKLQAVPSIPAPRFGQISMVAD